MLVHLGHGETSHFAGEYGVELLHAELRVVGWRKSNEWNLRHFCPSEAGAPEQHIVAIEKFTVAVERKRRLRVAVEK